MISFLLGALQLFGMVNESSFNLTIYMPRENATNLKHKLVAVSGLAVETVLQRSDHCIDNPFHPDCIDFNPPFPPPPPLSPCDPITPQDGLVQTRAARTMHEVLSKYLTGQLSWGPRRPPDSRRSPARAFRRRRLRRLEVVTARTSSLSFPSAPGLKFAAADTRRVWRRTVAHLLSTHFPK